VRTTNATPAFLLVTAAASAIAIALPLGSTAHAQHASPEVQAILAAHATERARVGVPALTWSPRLATLAREWAQHLCARARHGRAVLEHRRSPRVGENLFWQGGGDPPSITTAVQSWADERRFFDVRTGACRGGMCGHYTQLVWRNTTSVGCASASCGANHFWVCDYDPPGNWIGQHPY
jgi:pathogenesis-related protein 1